MFASPRTLLATVLCLVLGASTVAAAPIPEPPTLAADLASGDGGDFSVENWSFGDI